MYDICIIGAGIAGMTAAIYARRAGLSAVLFEKNIFGGQMVESAEIGNYPGIISTNGPELAYQAYEQAAALGAEVIYDTIEAVVCDEGIWKLTGRSGAYESRAVIIANGATHRKLGCKGELEFAQKGVSYCATCDGSFFKGKSVSVVGGGNTALEDALFLANLCEKVYLIHRRDKFRGDMILVESVKKRDNIELVLDSQIEEITGTDRVEGVDTVSRSGEHRHIAVSAVFVAVGVQPDTEIVRGLAECDQSGYIIADENGETGVSGLYAAGDCRSKRVRQIVTAAADGANAAFSASNYINQMSLNG